MIDENKLKKYIMTKINPYGKPFEGTVYEFGNMIMDYIERMEKVTERKKGRWKAEGIAIVCDQCGKGLVVEQGDADMNFCPNCGADMRGDKDDRREEAD